MIYSGAPAFAGPADDLLQGGYGFTGPAEELLQDSYQEMGSFYDPNFGLVQFGYTMGDAYVPFAEAMADWGLMDANFGWGIPNPIKAIKKVGKATVGAVKSGAKAVGKAGKAIGKGALAAGKFTVKIGGKVVDIALMPMELMMKVSLKIANTICTKIPPALIDSAVTAASASMGAPVPPQQAAMARKAFCSMSQAMKEGKITNPKDLLNYKKMLPLMAKATMTATSLASQQAAAAAQQGMQQQMAADGASPAEQAAAGQVTGFAELESILDQAEGQLQKTVPNINRAFQEGKKAANKLMSPGMRDTFQKATAAMTGMAAEAKMQQQIDASAGAPAGPPPGRAGMKKVAGGSVGNLINQGAAALAKKIIPPRILAEIRAREAEIKQFKNLGRMDLAAKVQLRVNQLKAEAGVDAQGTMAGYMGEGMTSGQKWGVGLLLASGLAAAGLGIYAARRGPALDLPVLY